MKWEDLDHEKLAEVGLAMLALTLSGGRAWKGLDWDVMDLLYKKGWIQNPATKARSVGFTAEGVEKAFEFLEKYFRKSDG